jgi:hypothetical protein
MFIEHDIANQHDDLNCDLSVGLRRGYAISTSDHHRKRSFAPNQDSYGVNNRNLKYFSSHSKRRSSSEPYPETLTEQDQRRGSSAAVNQDQRRISSVSMNYDQRRISTASINQDQRRISAASINQDQRRISTASINPEQSSSASRSESVYGNRKSISVSRKSSSASYDSSHEYMR